jgi:hypothetical protein
VVILLVALIAAIAASPFGIFFPVRTLARTPCRYCGGSGNKQRL